MSGIPLAVVGAGKMGALVASLAPSEGFDVVATIRRGESITRESLRGAQVAIEFTEPRAAAANVNALLAADCAVVCGTTGWDAERPSAEARATQQGALLWAPNFSLGVHLFTAVVAEAARRAKAAGLSGHMIETHHVAKKDAPSGTARHIASAAAQAGSELPITSVRVGHVPGTHEVVFDGAFEQIRLVHEARDRRVFALGALTAARWIAGKRGVFTLDDVLGGV